MSVLISGRMALICFILSSFSFSEARLVGDQDYGYPKISSERATLTAVAVYDGGIQPQKIEVKIKHPKHRRHRELELSFVHAPNSSNKNLVVILSGLGADDASQQSRFLAWKALEMGYSAIILPSPITPEFARVVSRDGLVGVTPNDSEEIYETLLLIRAKLEKKGYAFPGMSLLGYSHGALVAAFLKKREQERRQLNITTSLLINPPVDLLYGMRMIDQRAKLADSTSFLRWVKIALRGKSLISKYKKIPTTSKSSQGFIEALKISDLEVSGLIGKGLSMGLGDVILAGQEITDIGVLPEDGMEGSAVKRYQDSARAKAANKLNFTQYLENFLTFGYDPYTRASKIDQLNVICSLPAVADIASRENGEIFVMHNADDFLLREGDIEWLESTFGDRALIYPRGGHMGNIWYPDNVKAIQNWLLSNTFQ